MKNRGSPLFFCSLQDCMQLILPNYLCVDYTLVAISKACLTYTETRIRMKYLNEGTGFPIPFSLVCYRHVWPMRIHDSQSSPFQKQ